MVSPVARRIHLSPARRGRRRFHACGELPMVPTFRGIACNNAPISFAIPPVITGKHRGVQVARTRFR